MGSESENRLDSSFKIFVTGISSIHGWPVLQALRRQLPPENIFGIRPPKMRAPEGKNISATCITDKKALLAIRNDFKPTHVIHCAGVCDLDVCEERPLWAWDMNVTGTQRIAEVFGNDIPVIYLSTDLVFSGENPPRGGYVEHHHPDPVSVAGKTFMHAEKYIRSCQEHCTIRLGLPLGSSVTGDKGAIDWIESRFKKNLPVTLFTDEFRSCVPCEEIGRMVTAALKKGVRGLYHYGGGESWSLHAIGEYVITRGNYPRLLLRGIKRSEEIGGPPRIGDVSLNSTALRTILG